MTNHLLSFAVQDKSSLVLATESYESKSVFGQKRELADYVPTRRIRNAR